MNAKAIDCSADEIRWLLKATASWNKTLFASPVLRGEVRLHTGCYHKSGGSLCFPASMQDNMLRRDEPCRIQECFVTNLLNGLLKFYEGTWAGMVELPGSLAEIVICVLDFKEPGYGIDPVDAVGVDPVQFPFYVAHPGLPPVIVVRSGMRKLGKQAEEDLISGELAHEMFHAVADSIHLLGRHASVPEEMLAMDAERKFLGHGRSQWEFCRLWAATRVWSMSGVPYGLIDGYVLFPFLEYLEKRFGEGCLHKAIAGGLFRRMKPATSFMDEMDAWVQGQPGLGGQRGGRPLGEEFGRYMVEAWFVQSESSMIHRPLLAEAMQLENGPIPLAELDAMTVSEVAPVKWSCDFGALMGGGVRIAGVNGKTKIEVKIPVGYEHWFVEAWMEVAPGIRGGPVNIQDVGPVRGIAAATTQGNLVVFVMNARLPEFGEILEQELDKEQVQVVVA